MRSMARYDASNAKVQVFTFKDGLLSAMAHDLKLEVTRFELDSEGVSTFDAGSLRVVKWGDVEPEFYWAVNNLTDTPPPPELRLFGNPLQYDPIGRAFRIGIRAQWRGKRSSRNVTQATPGVTLQAADRDGFPGHRGLFCGLKYTVPDYSEGGVDYVRR